MEHTARENICRGEKRRKKKERKKECSCKIARSQILHFATEFQPGLNFTCQPNHKSSAPGFILPTVQAPEFHIRSYFTWQPAHKIPHQVKFYPATRPQNSAAGPILPGNQPRKFHTRSHFSWEPGHKIPDQVTF